MCLHSRKSNADDCELLLWATRLRSGPQITPNKSIILLEPLNIKNNGRLGGIWSLITLAVITRKTVFNFFIKLRISIHIISCVHDMEGAPGTWFSRIGNRNLARGTPLKVTAPGRRAWGDSSGACGEAREGVGVTGVRSGVAGLTGLAAAAARGQAVPPGGCAPWRLCPLLGDQCTGGYHGKGSASPDTGIPEPLTPPWEGGPGEKRWSYTK